MRIVLLFALTACNDPTWHVRLPDHSDGYVTECATYQGDCIRRASATCPEGYDVVEQTPGHIMNTSGNHTFAFRCSSAAPVDTSTSVGCGPGYAAQKSDAGANICVRSD